MKKIIPIFVIIVMLSTVVFGADAPSGAGGNGAVLKGIMLASTDFRIQFLEGMKTNTAANQFISQEDKDILNAMIDDVMTNLGDYKVRIQAVSSLQEAQALNEELNQYIQSEREKFAVEIQRIVDSLNEEMLVKFDTIVA